MKQFTNKSVLITFLTLSTIFLFTSCLPDVEDPPAQLQIAVEIESIDSTLATGNDSLTIDRVRMIHGKSFFVISEDSTIPLTGVAHQLTIEERERNIGLIYPLRGIGPFPEGVYDGLTFKIIRASEDEDILNLDQEFLSGGRFSIIVEGTYNDSSFTFKSSRNFTYPFQFIPPISVAANRESYILLISTNVESWFGKSGGPAYYDPRISENDSLINNNIAESFTIEQLQP